MRENRIRFLIDEDTSHVIRDGLRHHQPEIEVRVVGGENAPPKGTGDDAILQFLEREGFILVTSNRSTMPTHLKAHLQKGGHVSGILLLRHSYDYGEIIQTLQLIWGAGAPEDFQDQITPIPYR